jgi:hypothetical protein
MIYDILAISSKYLTNDLSSSVIKSSLVKPATKLSLYSPNVLEGMFLGYRLRLRLAATYAASVIASAVERRVNSSL